MDVDARARALYGSALGRAEGVLHVTSVGRVAGHLRVLRIGPAPRSETDFFALSLTRARVDAILLTGSVLRAEPALRCDLPEDLSAWRGGAPAQVVVLSRGEGLPIAHPLLARAADTPSPRVLTLPASVAALRASLAPHVEVVGLSDLSPRVALRWLREEAGARAVSIEAGPAVASPLYEAPGVVDELLLSVYEGPLTEAQHVAPFLDELELRARFTQIGGPTAIDEPSGRWVFSRWRRRG